jgi:uncharacterized membrane protein
MKTLTSFNNNRRAALSALLLLSIFLAVVLPLRPVHAEGGIAMSGTFYLQQFETPQGTEVSNESVYVVLFNQGDTEITGHLTTAVPDEVEISFSEQDFPLQPGEQKKVYIGVRVGEDAVPGEYKLTVTAEGRERDDEGGIQIIAGVAQEASLTVTGEAGWITIQVVSPEGDPVVSSVRLFKSIQGNRYEFASSENGTLEAKVSLGQYVACAYVGGELFCWLRYRSQLLRRNRRTGLRPYGLSGA